MKRDVVSQVIFAGLVAAIGTTIGLLLARPLLIRHVLDAPNHRSSHVVPTARGGGVGVLLGVIAGLLAGSSQFPNERGPFTVALALTLFALLGLVEDLFKLPVTARLLGQIVLVTGCAIAIRIATLGDMPGFSGLVVATGLGLMGIFYVNAANFMDGVNGISGLHGLVGGGYFSLIGFSASSSVLLVCGLVVSVAFAVFLPWNLLPPGLFLGDTGSYLLGASIWLMAAGAILLDMNVIVALAPLVIYGLDVAATLVRRLVARANLVAPHREHTYQQIQQLTDSHAAAALVCTSATLLCVFTGWLTWTGLPVGVAVSMLASVGLIYLCLPSMLRRRSMRRAVS